MDRRDLLKGGLAGALTLWASPLLQAANTVSVLDGGGTNVVALSTADGVVLVDTGTPGSSDRVMAALKKLVGTGKVHTVFNTHYRARRSWRTIARVSG